MSAEEYAITLPSNPSADSLGAESNAPKVTIMKERLKALTGPLQRFSEMGKLLLSM